MPGPASDTTDFRCTECRLTLLQHGLANHPYTPDTEEKAFRSLQRDRARAIDQKQVGGDHYLRSIQILDIVEVWELDYFRGSVLKYLLRAGHKGPKVEDLEKARHFLDRAIEIAKREG